MVELETKAVLKQLSKSHRYLAELKGISKTIPNQGILINTLPLLEAKDSSAIENIITTHDELYRETLFGDLYSNAAAKEVQNYSRALRSGFEAIQKTGLLSNRQILEIQECIEQNRAGFRTQAGTKIVNDLTNEIVYEPPQSSDDILHLMGNLEKYINDDSMSLVDSLIKMTVIHFQFESIHPFYDGNGRTGRILNILYLVYKGLLDIPVLYLSRYIIRNKADYYNLIQDVRDNGNWETWILFMLVGIEQTAIETIDIVNNIRELMDDYKLRLKDTCPFYSQDLLNNLFSYPYTKIEFLEEELGIHRQTASKYLKLLVDAGFLRLEKIGKHHYFINEPLFNLFSSRES